MKVSLKQSQNLEDILKFTQDLLKEGERDSQEFKENYKKVYNESPEVFEIARG